MTSAEIAMLVSAVIPLIGALAAYLKARAAADYAEHVHLQLSAHLLAEHNKSPQTPEIGHESP